MTRDESRRRPSRGSASRDLPASLEDAAAIGHRHARLEHILHEELSTLLRDEVSDPRLLDLRFTRVTLSADYHHARVRFQLDPAAETRPPLDDLTRALERVSGFLRSRLVDSLDLKRVPNLRFLPELDHDASEDDDPWRR